MKRFPHLFIRSLFFLLLAISLRAADQPDVQYIDLGAALNRSIEDDGVAGNGEGGWTDEGINDMFVYPPVPRGEFHANAHAFRTDPDGRVIMLKGSRHHGGFPASAKVTTPPVHGRYIYVMHQSAGFTAKPGERVAVYRVLYADGQSAELEVKQNEQMMHWWTGQWWTNSGANSWPVHMGRNAYSRKWHQYIGIWATRWQHPRPDSDIVGLEFVSDGKSTPVIWAVTVTDADFHADEKALKADFKRPGEAPGGYFNAKLALENRAIFKLMKAQGWADGVLDLTVIAPDLVAVRIDAAASEGPGNGGDKVAALQAPAAFAIASADDAALDGQRPVAVGRDSYQVWSGDIGPFPMNPMFQHVFYLRLPKPLTAGCHYTIRVSGLPEGTSKTEATLNWDDLTLETPVIKVNQHGYAPAARQRYAFLGWWAGDLGAVDYAAFATAELRDAAQPDRVVATLPLEPATVSTTPDAVDGVDAASGERVRRIDLSGLTEPGRYFIRVPGVGRSVDFDLLRETMLEAARAVSRSLLHQRCGCELTEESTRFPRPACHLETYRSGKLVGGINERYENGKRVVQNQPESADDPLSTFAGGYHDAADFDLFYSHFMGTADMLTAYEFADEKVRAIDLNLPEKESALPDLLDEAIWSLKFYTDNQAANGAVPAGRGNDEDYVRKEWMTEWAKDFGGLPPFGVLPPCRQSSLAYAALASQLARCLRPLDATRAADYQARAIRAFAWAQTEAKTPYELAGPSYGRVETPFAVFWAAAELYKTTGDASYNEALMAQGQVSDPSKIHWNQVSRQPLFLWPYATAEGPEVDAELQQKFRSIIIRSAESNLRNTQQWTYPMATTRADGGWGSLSGGGRNGLTLLRAWLLTGEQRFYDAASLNADYQLGANPLSRSFITGLGERPPIHPEVRGILTHGPNDPVAGIAVFGPGGGAKAMPGAFPAERPSWRCWMDNPVSAIHNEFGTDRLGREAAFYLLLASDPAPMGTVK